MNAFSRFSRVKTRWRRKKRKRRRGDLSVIKNGRALEKRAALLHKKKKQPPTLEKENQSSFYVFGSHSLTFLCVSIHPIYKSV